MRKLNLSSYPVDVHTERGIESMPFDVKSSICNALYHPDLKLSARELLDNDRLAQKIKGSTESILLEDAEYNKVLKAFETLRGFEVNDVEMVKRVLNAEEVKVKEA